MSAALEALCVVAAVTADPEGPVGITAIDKRPVDGERRILSLGVEGDRVEDHERHGGTAKAVYAYAAEDLAFWAAAVSRPLPAGCFGENLSTRGLEVTGAVIGQTWQLGTAVVQVTMPRMPCATFQRWMREPQWVKRFTEAGRPGAYLRVVLEGSARAGDAIEVLDTPAHGVTIAEVFAGRNGRDRGALERLLAHGEDLEPDLVHALERALSAGSSR